MSTAAFKQQLADLQASLGVKGNVVRQISASLEAFMTNTNISFVAGTEGFQDQVCTFNGSTNKPIIGTSPGMTATDIYSFVSGAYEKLDVKIDGRTILDVTERVAEALAGNTSRASIMMNADQMVSGAESLVTTVSPGAMNLYAANGLESFGSEINNLAANMKMSIMLTILQPVTGHLDRMFARKTASSDSSVTIGVSLPEYFDLEKSRNASAAVRNGAHRQPFVGLYRDPEPVDTSLRPIVVRSANDPDQKYILQDQVLKPNAQINLFDLSSDPNRVGYAQTDATDMVADGGMVTAVYIKATHTDGATVVEETFRVLTGAQASSRFTVVSNANDAAMRIATPHARYSVTKGSKTAASADTAIFDDYTDTKVNLSISINSQLNLREGNITTSGAVSADLVSATSGAVAAPLVTDFGKIKFSITGYETDLRWSEENYRKSTMAVRITASQKVYHIPPARAIIADVSHQQAGSQSEEAMTRICSDALTLGNVVRGLGVINGHIDNVEAAIAHEKMAGTDVQLSDRVAYQFACAGRTLPAVVRETLEYDDPNNPIANMRESEIMADCHGRARARMNAVFGRLLQESLYRNVLNPNEVVVFKVLTGSRIVNNVIGITDYHNTLLDKSENAPSSSTYSMELPNGTRVDFISCDFDSLQDKMISVPVRDSAPDDVTSFGTIYDRGIYTGSFSFSQDGGAWKRNVMGSRELLIVTNPIAAVLSIQGLEKIYGPSGSVAG
jgi:hypothetical protein